MRPEYSLKENLIIDKVEKFALYIDRLIDKQEIFSPPKYIEMLNYLERVLKMKNIDEAITKYSKYILDTSKKFNSHNQYLRYIKLQKLKNNHYE